MDGAKRVAAWKRLCCPSEPPRVVAKNRRGAGRLLCAAQHHQRAADVLGASVLYDANLATVLRLPPELVAPLVALMHKRSAWEIRNDMEAHRPQRRGARAACIPVRSELRRAARPTSKR